MPNPHDSYFSRTELEWEELEAVGWDLLTECRARLTTYTDLKAGLQ